MLNKIRKLYICFFLIVFAFAQLANAISAIRLSSLDISYDIINLLSTIRKTLILKYPPFYDNKTHMLSGGFKPTENIENPFFILLDSADDLSNIQVSDDSVSSKNKALIIYNLVKEIFKKYQDKIFISEGIINSKLVFIGDNKEQISYPDKNHWIVAYEISNIPSLLKLAAEIKSNLYKNGLIIKESLGIPFKLFINLGRVIETNFNSKNLPDLSQLIHDKDSNSVSFTYNKLIAKYESGERFSAINELIIDIPLLKSHLPLQGKIRIKEDQIFEYAYPVVKLEDLDLYLDTVVEERNIKSTSSNSVFSNFDQSIFIATKSPRDSANNAVRRLGDWAKSRKNRFFLSENGIVVKTTSNIKVQLVPLSKDSTDIPKAYFFTKQNIKNIKDLVEKIDNHRGNFKSTVRLLSYWNYAQLGKSPCCEKPFKSLELVGYALDYVNKNPNNIFSSVQKFMLSILSHVKKNLNTSIDLVQPDPDPLKQNAIRNFQLESLNHAIEILKNPEADLNILFPELKSRQSLDEFAEEIQAKINNKLIKKTTNWIQNILPDLVKQVNISGSTARGTAIKGKSDIDFILVLKDFVPFKTHEQIQKVLEKIMLLIRAEGARCSLQMHSLAIDSIGELLGLDKNFSFDLAIGKDEPDSKTIQIFQVNYLYEPFLGRAVPW